MHYVIIGTSAAGMGVIARLRSMAPDAKITCISDEAEKPYNKCFLDDWLLKKIDIDRVYTRSMDFFDRNNIELKLGACVTKIDRANKILSFADGGQLGYDRLFVGTGTRPRVLDIPGSTDCKQLFYFHGLGHAQELIKFIEQKKPRTAVVIGAGLSGLECADGLIQRGLEVSVVERGAQILSHQVDSTGAHLIGQYLADTDGKLYTNTAVKRLVIKDKQLDGVELASGQTLCADLVVCAAGANVNSEIARDAKLVMRGDFINVNEQMQTSDPNIFAGGDCVVVKDLLSGEMVPSCTWPDAMLQGVIAAHNMAGRHKLYPGALIVTSSSFFGVQFVTCGPVAKSHGHQERVSSGKGWYHKLLINEHKQLRGYLLVGNTNSAVRLKRLVQTGECLEG
jgi:nitrite reductase (NADH) large subunit